MTDKCRICGGTWTCPGYYHRIILRPTDRDDRQWLPADAPAPGPDWIATHRKRRWTLWYRRTKHGLPLHLCGSRQAERIYSHTGLRLPWATMATYAYHADPCPDPDQPGPGYIPQPDQ